MLWKTLAPLAPCPAKLLQTLPYALLQAPISGRVEPPALEARRQAHHIRHGILELVGVLVTLTVSLLYWVKANR